MAEWLIRPVQPTDQPAWLRMRLALWPHHTPEELQVDLHEESECRQGMAAFVAEMPGQRLCGLLEASLRNDADGCSTSPVGYIEGWYVDEPYRRLGIGAALVAAAESWALSLGCREMASDCLLQNETSLQAHIGLGYQEVDRLICFRKQIR